MRSELTALVGNKGGTLADRLVALKAVLDELGVPLKIDSVQDRLVVQKAIYLAQTKVPLGYSYGWYLKGPYSPRLTRDYYEFSQASLSSTSHDLKDSVRALLKSVKELIGQKPSEATLAQWLELLASIHYLKQYWSLDKAGVVQKIGETKPHLNHLVDSGWSALQH